MQRFAKEILKLFGPEVTALLDDGKIDSMINAMSLQYDLHAPVSSFRIYFEPTGEDTYVAKGWKKPYPRGIPSPIITFSNGADSSIALPSGELLRVHRAIGRILYISGAGDSIGLLRR